MGKMKAGAPWDQGNQASGMGCRHKAFDGVCGWPRDLSGLPQQHEPQSGFLLGKIFALNLIQNLISIMNYVPNGH